jgi:hypothetical protein
MGFFAHKLRGVLIIEVGACVKGARRISLAKPEEVNRKPHETRERKFNYAEGVTEISLGLERSDYPRKAFTKIIFTLKGWRRLFFAGHLFLSAFSA